MSSMSRDFARGRRIELDTFNGAIVRMGAEFGVDVGDVADGLPALRVPHERRQLADLLGGGVVAVEGAGARPAATDRAAGPLVGGEQLVLREALHRSELPAGDGRVEPPGAVQIDVGFVGDGRHRIRAGIDFLGGG